MNVAFLGLGGNMGDRLENLRATIDLVKQHCGEVLKISGVYETEAWGSDSKNSYLNQVVKINTHLTLTELLENMMTIEQKLGRVRKDQNSDRTADLDILFYNDLILHTQEIQVPHPRLHLRKFVLIPLAEIEPLLVHPELKKTVKELLEDCKDTLKVDRL